MRKAFTLVELVIVIIIVGILSLVAVPIYRKYVLNAKITEAKATANAIRTAFMLYYLETGDISFSTTDDDSILTDLDNIPELGIDTRSNKYYKGFHIYNQGGTGRVSTIWIRPQGGKPAISSENPAIGLIFSVAGDTVYSGTRLPAFTLYDGTKYDLL